MLQPVLKFSVGQCIEKKFSVLHLVLDVEISKLDGYILKFNILIKIGLAKIFIPMGKFFFLIPKRMGPSVILVIFREVTFFLYAYTFFEKFFFFRYSHV